ncbi:site-specific integrase [Gluconobacter kondonii]|uniref:site-specific integrase n=1 Tax=Gluconobacter kondonii TaxID=941463 RepID=UPI001B8AED18|nr:site-specific integrase [Gluconobacter kondonii]MBS1056129.1 site-specific integrase [Gluconobacter kondonii]
MSETTAPRLCRVKGRDAWHIYYERKRISTGCKDRASAELVLSKFTKELSRPQTGAIGISKILDLYLADRRDAEKPGAERLAWAHKQLKEWFGEKPPEEATDSVCRAYSRYRIAAGISTSTARTELQALRAALRWAAKEKLIAEAPTVPLPPRSAPKERWLTREEASALLEGCEAEHVKLFVVLALGTAARVTSLLELTWSRVDLERRIIDLRDPNKPKTSKGRARVPINDTLLDHLKQAHQLRETKYVIEWAGDRIRSIKRGFRAATERAGLENVTPHTLRHTAATWMAQAGIPLWEIAGFLGHSNTRMVEETYAHHSPQHLTIAAKYLSI